MGSLEQGKKYYDDALAMAREINYRESEPYPMERLGDVLQAQGDSAGAEKQYEQALALSRETKNSGLELRILFNRTSMALDAGDFTGAEKGSREILKELDPSNPGGAAEAEGMLARSLLGHGKTKDARAAASRAISLAAKSNAKPAYFEAVLADGRVKAKSGQYREGHQELEDARAKAAKFGYLLYENEIRLALCEIELAADAPGAQADLKALENDAQAQGNGDIVSRAKALSAGK
jgi:tetratricopeptide (TPR) repeat protein